jgi:hypothetical protein
MDRIEYVSRKLEFPPAIRAAGLHNSAIARIIEEYSHGRICFLNEALGQMVIILARDWTEEQDRMFALQFPALGGTSSASPASPNA